MNGTIIAAIVCFAVAVVGAWITYRMFHKKNGPTVGPFGFVEAISKRKENGMDVIEYKISLPVSPSTDVVKKILTIRREETNGGMFPLVESRDLDNAETEARVKAVQDTRVDLELLVEDNGNPPNRSDAVYMHFTALDTIRPVLTGEMTAEAVSEDPAPPETSEETPAADGDPAETPTDTPPAETSDPAGEAADPEAPPAHVPPADTPETTPGD